MSTAAITIPYHENFTLFGMDESQIHKKDKNNKKLYHVSLSILDWDVRCSCLVMFVVNSPE